MMFKKDNSNIEKKLDEIIIAIKDLNNSILNLKMNGVNEAYNQNIYRGVICTNLQICYLKH